MQLKDQWNTRSNILPEWQSVDCSHRCVLSFCSFFLIVLYIYIVHKRNAMEKKSK